MIRSMTGFGKTECQLPDKKLTIEIKSLNGKQLDTGMRIPSVYREKELEIRQLIASVLERGKVDCTMYYELNGDACSGAINEQVVLNYYEQLRRISGTLGLEASVELLTTVMRLPDTVKTERNGLQEGEWKLIEDALRDTLRKVDEFRIREGEVLAKDLRERVRLIRQKLGKVDPYENERIQRIRDRIGNNLVAFLKSREEVDENRLEQEVIFYLEKLDMSEEKVRLANHCDYFLETMEEEESPGKKLGFITQELGREINTLGSKANHSEIQRIVVEMKDELEKIKEQILNVL
jgi:uncharacterized protein (TIGR00255 family)